MNDVLKLNGTFFSRKSPGRPGPPSLPASAEVSSRRLRTLAEQLEKITREWHDECITKKLLVSVYYKRVIAKSGRTQRILAENSKGADFTVVGSKFEQNDERIRHVVTHCISKAAINRSISELSLCATILDSEFGGNITHGQLAAINSRESRSEFSDLLKKYKTTRSGFSQVIADACLVERYGIEKRNFPEITTEGPAIVTLYDTGEPLPHLLKTLDIRFRNKDILDETSIVMERDELELLMKKAPYLVAMSSPSVVDWTNRTPEAEPVDFRQLTIPKPGNEPVIGVIDTLFEKDINKVYFSDWVEYEDLVDRHIERSVESYIHGTKVSSIIVDGPSLTPWLDDGCGRFRVKHFGIANGSKVNLLTILRLVPQIVSRNRNIKVWNLSLGSPLPVSQNSVSPVAHMLDKLQHDYNVTFVVAGTNDPDRSPNQKKWMGSPADSINSLVVNSIKRDGSPASYSRRGPILSFYGKPDVCYFGGDTDEPLTAYAPWGEDDASGTSYAAPWVARKLAYLIEIVGLTREAAKALLIDAAAGWRKEDNTNLKGYGPVPISIHDILHTRNDEIKFILSGKSTMFDTYTYRLPVPVSNERQPYYAKATLCYFPQCSRNQGVDYTNTELDLRIGRLTKNGIKSIDNNMQGEPGNITYEETARKFFRKWDNVKVVGEEIKQQKRPRKVYESEFWGISVKAKERFNNTPDRSEVAFSVVVTLKEMFGVNRIDEFIRRCELAQWRVTRLDVENRLDLFNATNEEIDFSE